MRRRKEIESDGKRVDLLALEVLLDCRYLLEKLSKGHRKRKQRVSEDKDNA